MRLSDVHSSRVLELLRCGRLHRLVSMKDHASFLSIRCPHDPRAFLLPRHIITFGTLGAIIIAINPMAKTPALAEFAEIGQPPAIHAAMLRPRPWIVNRHGIARPANLFEILLVNLLTRRQRQ